jgi:hypothetical protein
LDEIDQVHRLVNAHVIAADEYDVRSEAGHQAAQNGRGELVAGREPVTDDGAMSVHSSGGKMN